MKKKKTFSRTLFLVICTSVIFCAKEGHYNRGMGVGVLPKLKVRYGEGVLAAPSNGGGGRLVVTWQ
jgi:hypothetical protein